jgi:hypothetical protein
MLQLKNDTPFKAAIMLLPDVQGIDTLFAIVKATFTIGPEIRLAEEQVPVALADKYHADPASSSIRVPSDVCLGKVGTDVVLTGSAWAPDGKPAWQMDVSLAVGPVAKTVRVSGDRVWDGGRGGATVSWVAPFNRMPLVWERAFGGSDTTPQGPAMHPRNPVGRGFRASNGSRPVSGQALPNLEDPAAMLTSPSDAPPPAGFAPVASSWLPRRAYAGTYDEKWQAAKAPYLPDDFDLRFFQIAPPGLTTPGFLQGGERVEVRGMTPTGLMAFALPALIPDVAFQVGNNSTARPSVLDTIILEPDEARFVMVWRASLACDKGALKVKGVAVRLASRGMS